MAKLNEYDENTKKNIHLLVTSLCDRNCKYCCNKQYDLNDIPYVTDEELRQAENIFITGGEPFLYSEPNNIALYYKIKYGIENVIVYTNASALYEYISHGGRFGAIDGLNVSIKNERDVIAMKQIIAHPDVLLMERNRLYVFDNLYEENPKGFEVFHRQWQEDFEPANDSVFRKI